MHPAPIPDGGLENAVPGRPGIAYLDTASIGLVPANVGAAVADCYRALGGGVLGMAATRPTVQRTRALLAEEFGCATEDITFTSSTGEAVNTVARAVNWRPGDEVVVLEDEFPTVLWPWSTLPDVRLVTVAPGPDDDRLGALTAAIGPRTRLVAVSHVNSQTGTVVDLAALRAACVPHGSLVFCDGAQSAGVLPVDVSQTDFFVSTGYKWMLAGFGIAFLITKPSVQSALRPTLLGHGNIPPSKALSVGTPNLAGIYALGAAAEFRRATGYDTISRRALELAGRIRDEATRLGLRSVAHPSSHSQIVSLAPAALCAGEYVTRLRHDGVVAADRGGNLRLSPHFYTRDSDVDDLLDALSRLPL
ncbi:aminotransferase class V-fold PLP-dependent enzyme [Streptomyces sp. NPDC003247]|uniref:aminotransferase class V-fold PLP-dependent enzyme n=1 Tax=Streptomyces sp. NPDC003247 TaxID=3364677 RepID=UPI0036B367CC